MTTIESPALTWDLDSLLPHPETKDFREVFESFDRDARALADLSDELPPVSADAAAVRAWCTFLGRLQDVEARHSDLMSFVGCHAAADADNRKLHQMEARLAGLGPIRQRIVSNVEFALAGASDEDLATFVASEPELTENRFYLEECRRNASLRLPKEQELLAADLGVDGLHAWGRLYNRISGELRVKVMERGEIVDKSPGQVAFDATERSVRENNFYAADKAWARIADTCADALNHISGTRLTLYRRLGLRDHLDAPLRMNRMRRETLEAMWSAVSERKSMLVPYLEKKAKLLGVPRLSWFDVQAPLPGAETTSRLSYEDACNAVLATFHEFSPELGDFGRKAIEGRWIEAENRAGKRQGGFCAGFPSSKESRIFMTFTGSADSMSTLAHELGHAYHSFVLKDRPLLLRRYPMNLAETASTFAETVLGEERLRTATSAAERLQNLDILLSDAVAMLMNIHARFVFEDNFHRERLDGEVTSARLSELMVDAQKETYLEKLDTWNPNFWVSKLHFYISQFPFYNFPYTFGYLLSLAIYGLRAEDEAAFPDRYRALLIATGCELTEDAVLGTFGHDLGKTDFWHRGLDIIEKRVEQFVAV